MAPVTRPVVRACFAISTVTRTVPISGSGNFTEPIVPMGIRWVHGLRCMFPFQVNQDFKSVAALDAYSNGQRARATRLWYGRIGYRNGSDRGIAE